MSGQLLRAADKDELAKHTHVVFTFTQGGQLRFVDPRTFGEMFVTTPEELTEEVPELAHLGIDPVEEPMSWQTFGHLLMRHPMKLKAFLMDQSIIAGLGNIYSDEILWQAGLRYDRLSDSLSTQEMRRLYAGAGRDPARRHQARRLDAVGPAVREPVGQARRVPGAAQGLRPREAGLPALPGARS